MPNRPVREVIANQTILTAPADISVSEAAVQMKTSRVGAVMVEVNRRLYMREVDATPSADFEDVALRIRESCVEAIASWSSWKEQDVGSDGLARSRVCRLG